MARLRKNIWRIAWFVALTLIVATWGRSYWFSNSWQWMSENHQVGTIQQQSGIGLSVLTGRVMLTWGKQWNDTAARSPWSDYYRVKPQGFAGHRSRSTSFMWGDLLGGQILIVDDELEAFLGGASQIDQWRWWIWKWQPLRKWLLGFEVATFHHSSASAVGSHTTQVAVPFWAMLVLLMVSPAWRHWKRRKPQLAGGCLACGYDLRAHGAGERCPECGAVKG